MMQRQVVLILGIVFVSSHLHRLQADVKERTSSSASHSTSSASVGQRRGSQAIVIGTPGQTIDITSFVQRGKTTIVDFSSPFCPPCLHAIPRLSKFAMSRGDVAAYIIDVNRAGVQGIDWASPVSQQYQLRSLPAYVVFGPDGRLLAKDDVASELVHRWISEAGF